MNTFDEAVEQVNILTEHGEIGIAPNAVLMILKDLQKKYEPTVEMTKEQHDLFISSTDFEKGQTDMDLGFGKMSLMQYAYIVTHPETIKEVEE